MPTDAPPAARPTKHIFDPFNSSATGHQRAENRLSSSTSWRESRGIKLREQFSAGVSGGKRVSDSVGAGSLNFGTDGRTDTGGWVRGAKGLRKGGQQSLWESVKVAKEADERPTKKLKVENNNSTIVSNAKSTNVVNPSTPFRRKNGNTRESSCTLHERSPSDLLSPVYPSDIPTPHTSHPATKEVLEHEAERPAVQIFANCNFYINGSTYPLSDHKLKHLVVTHGGSFSITLGRRSVTHVIIGRPNSNGGSGGGLAGIKIQKEIEVLRGKAKFVTADWISESVKANKKLPESRFAAMRLAPKGVEGIDSLFKPTAAREE